MTSPVICGAPPSERMKPYLEPCHLKPGHAGDHSHRLSENPQATFTHHPTVEFAGHAKGPLYASPDHRGWPGLDEPDARLHAAAPDLLKERDALLAIVRLIVCSWDRYEKGRDVRYENGTLDDELIEVARKLLPCAIATA